MTKLLSIFAIIGMFALSACAAPRPFSHGVFNRGKPQLVAQPDKVTAMLADSASKVSKSLETLAAVEYAKTPNVSVAPIGNAPPSLERAITVNWVGPVEQITKTLADRASYEFGVIGDVPAVPIVVSIDVENASVIEVLRNIGLQLGTRADVKVNGANQTIEIHYPPAPDFGVFDG